MRGTPPSDFTKQEKIIAEVLSDYGLRYKEQENIGKYYADFFVPELNTVIEADGIYGHLKKADAKRDKEIIDLLCQIKGIGWWTAEMFLIFHLDRPNILPLGDIGLIKAIELNYNNGEKISKDRINTYRQKWSPWCTVATWYLWRSLDPIPVNY